MTKKTEKRINACCILALMLSILWAMYELLYIIGLFTGWGVVKEKVDWMTNSIVKWAIFIIFLLSIVSLIGLCIKIVENIHAGVREHVAFPQDNVKLLFWFALADFIYRLSWANIPVLFQDDFTLFFTGANLIMPFLLLFFAFMYKVAADAVEENNLTV